MPDKADDIQRLVERIEGLADAIEDGVDQLHWINAQALSILEATGAVIARTEEGAATLMMIDSMASDIGVNAMMLQDKLETALRARITERTDTPLSSITGDE